MMDSSSDCISKRELLPSLSLYSLRRVSDHSILSPVMVLSPLSGTLLGGVTLLIIVTISGNSPSTPQNTPTERFERPADDHLINVISSTRETSRSPTLSVLDGSSLRTVPKTNTTISSNRLAQLNPRFAQDTPQSLQSGSSITTGAVTGLASAVSDLEWMVNFDNLQADVSESHSHLLFINLTDHNIGP